MGPKQILVFAWNAHERFPHDCDPPINIASILQLPLMEYFLLKILTKYTLTKRASLI